VPSNTSRAGRTVIRLAMVVLVVGGVLGVVVGSWSGVVLAAVGVVFCCLLLVMGRTRAAR
jgi:hypothetical protein